MLDSVVCANACASRVSRGTKPVVLRCTSRASSPASVGSPIDGLAKNLVSKNGIVRDDGGGQVVRSLFTDFEHLVKLVAAVLSDNLEWSKKFSRQQLSLPLPSEVLERYEDSSWFPRSVAIGN
jgi:hypothetical protein